MTVRVHTKGGNPPSRAPGWRTLPVEGTAAFNTRRASIDRASLLVSRIGIGAGLSCLTYMLVRLAVTL